LVAHSFGAILCAGLAHERIAAKIGAALLVAPCDLDRARAMHPGSIHGFGAMPALRLPFPTVVVASRNDPYMDFPAAIRMAGIWGASCVDLGEAGHINIASGHGHWPLGHALALMLERRAAFHPPGKMFPPEIPSKGRAVAAKAASMTGNDADSVSVLAGDGLS
jgi:hypothetical protein